MKKRTLGLIVIAILLVFNISERGYADLKDGLVAYYPFNGNANDESGNGNNGSITGNITWVNGKYGLAALFNGTNSFIEISKPGSFSEATIGGWIQWKQFNYWSRFFDFGKYREAIHVCNAKNSNELLYDCHFQDETNVYTGFNIKNNEWYHILL